MEFEVGPRRFKIPATKLIITGDVYVPNAKRCRTREGKVVQAGYLSASQRDMWLKCHSMFKKKYEERLPDRRPAPSMWNGSAAHSAFEILGQHKLDGHHIPLEVALQTYTESLMNDISRYETFLEDQQLNGGIGIPMKWPGTIRSKEELNKLGRDLVTEFHTNWLPKIRPKQIEEAVLYSLNLKNRVGSVPFLGFVDLIEEDDDGLCVSDYKTGMRERSQSDLEADDQLTLYCLALGIDRAAWYSMVLGTSGRADRKTGIRSGGNPGRIVKLITEKTDRVKERFYEDANFFVEGLHQRNFARTGKFNSQICSSVLCPYHAPCMGTGA